MNELLLYFIIYSQTTTKKSDIYNLPNANVGSNKREGDENRTD